MIIWLLCMLPLWPRLTPPSFMSSFDIIEITENSILSTATHFFLGATTSMLNSQNLYQFIRVQYYHMGRTISHQHSIRLKPKSYYVWPSFFMLSVTKNVYMVSHNNFYLKHIYLSLQFKVSQSMFSIHFRRIFAIWVPYRSRYRSIYLVYLHTKINLCKIGLDCAGRDLQRVDISI